MGEEGITELLHRWGAGEPEAFDCLFPILYRELQAMGERLLGGRGGPGTLQRTALVHEVFLKLKQQERLQWTDRNHFMAFVARVMRQILVDYARGQIARKRWGGQERVPLELALDKPSQADRELLDVHDALDRLALLDPPRARLVELRYFGGFTLEEIAELDSVSLSTVKRDWNAAKLWLFTDLQAVVE